MKKNLDYYGKNIYKKFQKNFYGLKYRIKAEKMKK